MALRWNAQRNLLTEHSCLLLLLLESNEFILYAVRNSIHRFDLATGTDQPLPLLGLHEAVALDFDYEKNCLYWADISLDTIQVNKHLFRDVQYIGAIYWLLLTDIGEFVIYCVGWYCIFNWCSVVHIYFTYLLYLNDLCLKLIFNNTYNSLTL